MVPIEDLPMQVQTASLSLLPDRLIRQLLGLRLANGDVPLRSIGVELSPAVIALNIRAHLLTRRLLLSRQRLPPARLDPRTKCSALELPFGHLALLGGRGRLLGLV